MNNNMMELNTEEVQKKREKEEKKQNFKNKIKRWKEKREEAKEDKKREKEEKERVKQQEKEEKERQERASKSTSYKEQTITNQTITKDTKEEKILTPQEERRKRLKRKKMIRNIMTIPEIILIILLAIFLKNKYTDYSKNVHQTLNYVADNYVYEIHRDNESIKVNKNRKLPCANEPCNVETLGGYEIQFSKNQMRFLRLYLDFSFMFKSNTKSISPGNIKTSFGQRCIYSMIHNDNSFLDFKKYNDYEILDYEQMSTYTTRGYKYQLEGDRRFLYVAMGEKQTSGYALVVNSAYKKGDDVYFYIQEQTPDEENSSLSLVTHPMVKIELKEAPKEIYVINVDTGEMYPNYDVPIEEMPNPSNGTNNGVSNTIGDLVGSLRDLIK